MMRSQKKNDLEDRILTTKETKEAQSSQSEKIICAICGLSMRLVVNLLFNNSLNSIL